MIGDEHAARQVHDVQQALHRARYEPEETIRAIAEIVGYYLADAPICRPAKFCPPDDGKAPAEAGNGQRRSEGDR